MLRTLFFTLSVEILEFPLFWDVRMVLKIILIVGLVARIVAKLQKNP